MKLLEHRTNRRGGIYRLRHAPKGEPKPAPPTLPLIDWPAARRCYMSAAALELKRRTPMFSNL